MRVDRLSLRLERPDSLSEIAVRCLADLDPQP